MGMYESPIELLITEVTNQIFKEQDEAIYKSVLNYVPNVDRTELLRALQYDRNQYEKGYADGKADAMAEVVRCKDCKHYKKDTMWCKVNSNPRSETYPNWYADDFCSYGERRTDERETD